MQIIQSPSVCASIGLVIAEAMFDASHFYAAWLMMVPPMVIAAAAIIALISFVVQTDVQDQDKVFR